MERWKFNKIGDSLDNIPNALIAKFPSFLSEILQAEVLRGLCLLRSMDNLARVVHPFFLISVTSDF